MRDQLNRLYALHTKQTVERIEKDIDRDRFMSAEEAMEYGLIDDIIAKVGSEVKPKTDSDKSA